MSQDHTTDTPLPPNGLRRFFGAMLPAFFLETVLPALVIVLLLNLFVAQATRVDGQSMYPTLHDGERLIIEKLSYRFRIPQRGEIIVLRKPQRSVEPLIKRVVALPGETIAVHDGYVYIDGKTLDEPYLRQLTSGLMPERVVPEGNVFVLGDNRGFSNDSRAFGFVPLEDIIGRAWWRYWPLSAIGSLVG